jgi:hypothetical protein
MGNRIHWAFDGTLAYSIDQGIGSRTAMPAATMNRFDSDPTQATKVGFGLSETLAFNFPSPVAIDQIGIRAAGNYAFTAQVSSDSTDGVDGTWEEVGYFAYSNFPALQFFAPTATAATWLRLIFPNNAEYYNLFLSGEYQAPRFEFWNAAGTAELTSEYPLAMASAPNLDDYAGSAQFKLKNTDGDPHSYSLTIKAVRYGGDTVITDNYKLSVDGGTNKLLTVVVGSIDPGNLSGVIDVYGEVAKANNPADGYHYFVVDVTETA